MRPPTIDKAFLKSLNPCTDRWENYLRHYPDFAGPPTAFLALDNITVEDKCWVLIREGVLSHEDLVELACRMAEHVLPYFEKRFPEDKRPRQAIEAARSGNSEAAAEAAWAARAARAAAWAAWAARAAEAAWAARAAAWAAEAAWAAWAAAWAAAAPEVMLLDGDPRLIVLLQFFQEIEARD